MMILYSGSTCPFSHRCRIVLHEKGGDDYQVRDLDLYDKPKDVERLNPYGQVPILVERDLTLYESNIINQYIDERRPLPPLMPTDSVPRGRARLFLFNLEREIFAHVQAIENSKDKRITEKARKIVAERLVHLAPLLAANNFLLGDEYSLVDVAMAPLLWRLDHYGIALPKDAAPLKPYGERLWARPAFGESLTPAEKVMRRG
jgi:stringent starvation protein A